MSQAKISDLSLCSPFLTQDRGGQEDRSKIMNNRTEQLISKVNSMYLGPKLFGVYKARFSAFSVETNIRKFGACYFLSIWLLKLDGAAQA